MAKAEASGGIVFLAQCIPTEATLLGVGGYKTFLSERRKSVSDRLNQFLQVGSVGADAGRRGV